MPVLGTPRTFFKRFKYVVEIDQFQSAGFQKCSELSVEVANIEHFEGGSLIPNKSPGRLKFADVTLERGATKDQDMFEWMSQVADAAANAGLVEPRFKRSCDLVQLDRDGTTLRRWSLSGAWPIKFVAGAWDNESDENVIESVTLTYDFFTLNP
jgi:phage tail-like protein